MQSIAADQIPFHHNPHYDYDHDKERGPEQPIIGPNPSIDVVLSVGALAYLHIALKLVRLPGGIRQIDPFGTESHRLRRSGYLLPRQPETNVLLRIEEIRGLDELDVLAALPQPIAASQPRLLKPDPLHSPL